MTVWRKSSRSDGTSTQSRVEVARRAPAVAVRDSKNPARGHLAPTATQFSAFVARIKHGDFD